MGGNFTVNRLAHGLGVIVQGIVLGVLLCQALFRLAAMVSGSKVFQYQGF